MVFRRRKPARRPRRKARKGRKPRRVNKLFQTSQRAIIKETIQFQNVEANTSYGFVFSISQFDRAQKLAANFKWYKAKSVEWSLEPLFNTFTDDGTPQSIPYLYTKMNRTQDSIAVSLQDLQASGMKPQKLTSKKVMKYVPNWCSPGLLSIGTSNQGTSGGQVYVNAVSQNGLKPQYGYLPCSTYNPPLGNTDGASMEPILTPNTPLLPTSVAVTTNQVIYNGHEIFLDQILSNPTIQVARITCTVTWEFKDPNFSYQQNQPTMVQPVNVPASA